MITWGDGHISAGNVVATTTAGRFDVTGSNLYLTPNTYSITIQVKDYQGNAVTIGSTAYVAAPVLTPIGTVANFITGVPPSSPVLIGSFLDADTAPVPGAFTTSIAWGDGPASTASVSASATTPGRFLVTGSNLYAAAGNYHISIAVQDNLGDMTTINSTAVVTLPVLT